MAEDKKSFLLYADLLHTIKKLPDDKAGMLFKTILEYVNDQNPQPDDLLVDITFEPIKQQLKRDLKHWEAIKGKRSEAGKASAEARKNAKEQEQKSTNSTNVESVQQKTTNSTVNVTVNGNVNDTVNVSVSEEQKRQVVGALMLEFGFNEIKHMDKVRWIWQFINHVESSKGIQYFIDTFQTYKNWKKISGEKSHNFVGLLGSPAMKFENGGWDSDNWQYKIDNFKPACKPDKMKSTVEAFAAAENPFRNKQQ